MEYYTRMNAPMPTRDELLALGYRPVSPVEQPWEFDLTEFILKEDHKLEKAPAVVFTTSDGQVKQCQTYMACCQIQATGTTAFPFGDEPEALAFLIKAIIKDLRTRNARWLLHVTARRNKEPVYGLLCNRAIVVLRCAT